MPHNQYRVVFVGDLVEVDKRAVVKRNLATLFGTNPGYMDRLFGRKPIILKKNLTRDEAVRFRDAIIRCGAFCRIETMDSVSPVQADLVDESGGGCMICPRCRKQQSKSVLCRFCGALVQEYSRWSDEDPNRRHHERRRDLETSVNVTRADERRAGRDRRIAHLDWRM